MSINSFNFYKADSVYGNLFFKFPKVLMYGTKYKKLSDTAKLAYMILNDRLEYSLRNNWVDEEQNVYFIFTNKELKDLFNCSNDKLATVKHELERAGLLFQKKIGFNPKTGRNEPNHLYLSKLDVQATDVYLRGQDRQKMEQTLDMSELPKNRHPLESVQSLDTSGLPKIGYQYKNVDNKQKPLDTSGLPKIGYNLDINLNKKLRDNKETDKLNFSVNQYSPDVIKRQNLDLVQSAKDYLPESATGGLFLNKEGVELLGLWCHSPKQMHRFLGIILNAKKAVEREHEGTAIVLDDPQCQEMINKTIRRFFNILRSDSKKINNVENYLFGAMKETLIAYWNKSLANTNRGDFNEL
ncbi:replication initiator protein A [Lacticaseibacillus paracasei]|uniref:Putative plasmid replication initiation protein n=1 Tax=Lacticaseibacillus paracasei NRIC 0644 TaxID=1435038 RepID=A0A0C9PPV3_LACPA|nr:replication initiator protein A [Lacticaseibacillus paracasei]GAN37031.1 putative plasmid replication initiation protein [Lacticaseibacillus paracasei NRIC 0644]